jgi:hypothetical protein
MYNCIMRKIWRYQREVIRICKSKKDRQHNGQKKRVKQWYTKHYRENWRSSSTWTPLKTGSELRFSGRISGVKHVTMKTCHSWICKRSNLSIPNVWLLYSIMYYLEQKISWLLGEYYIQELYYNQLCKGI